MWYWWTEVRFRPSGKLSRRTFLCAGTSLAGLVPLVAACAAHPRAQQRSCILLWMGGGPSQFESFDPKPHAETGGGTKTIATSVPGLHIAEYWPRMAQQMHRVTLVRSMVARESNHQRATYHMHTGHLPAAGVIHPSMGSIVASRTMPVRDDLPQFVSIGGPTHGAGLFGARYDPMVVEDPSRPPQNLVPPVPRDVLARRLKFAEALRRKRRGTDLAFDEYVDVQRQAIALATGTASAAFDLSREPQAVRRRYGETRFGKSCLLARRLVEAGVTFVEVRTTGWDTHRRNFEITPQLAALTDGPFATLLEDLRERGLWERTLVIWIGEFGRTPKINPMGGRDHWPQAFSAILAGAGLPEGAVIGKTSRDGSEVVEDPVHIPDLFATVCKVFGIDADEEYESPLGQPIRLVDGGKSLI